MRNSNSITLGPSGCCAGECEQVEIKVNDIGFGVCLVLCDPELLTIAVAHVLFPDSADNTQGAIQYPVAYADTAVGALLAQLIEVEEEMEHGEVEVSSDRIQAILVGACDLPLALSPDTSSNSMNLGKCTLDNLRSELTKSGLVSAKELVGGTQRRKIAIRDAKIRIFTEGEHQEERSVEEIVLRDGEVICKNDNKDSS